MDRVEYISFLHKQNLNGRETEDELFEAGIIAGIEETEELIIEFANWFLSTRFDSSGKYLNKTDNELLEIFKRERSETVA